MSPQIDVLSARDRWRLVLSADRMTVGKATQNDIVVEGDPAVSHLHAIFERFEAGWCVSDLGSSNGTWLNGQRIWSSQRLRNGDEVRVGQTRLVFLDSAGATEPATEMEEQAPALTTRERDVLVALCRPLLARDLFTQPAATRAIADELVITQASVKQHLVNLYDKFGVSAEEADRRVRLANEALKRGAVTLADLRASDAP
jgi:pSer/pThr/pTyr-binding forkhead associated (FHA) protein